MAGRKSNRPRASKLADQMTLGMDAPDIPKEQVGEPHPSLSPGCTFHGFIDFTPQNWAYYFHHSENANKDKLSDTKEIACLESLRQGMREDTFDLNGDAVIFDEDLRIIEGLKRATAGMECGKTVRILAIVVEMEARFYTGRPRRNGKQAVSVPHRLGEMPARPLSVDYASLPSEDVRTIRRIVDVRDGVARSLGHDCLQHWTAIDLSRSLRSAASLVAWGVPAHLAGFAHACLADVMPAQAEAFIRIWADAGITSGSAPASLSAALARDDIYGDDHKFIRLVALAAESFVADLDEDPIDRLRDTERNGAQLLQVLVGKNGRRAERLLTVGIKAIPLASMPELLGRSGINVEELTAKEIERLAPMVRDIKRGKGLFLCGETLKITADGKVIDGVARILASYLAGCDAVVHAVEGFREDFQHARTRGRAQSLGHRYYAEDYVSPYDISGILNYIYCLTINQRGVEATMPHLRHLHGQHSQVQRTVAFVHPLKIRHNWRISKAVMGAAHILMSRYSRELADSFIDELIEILELGEAGGNFVPELNRQRTLKLLADRLREVYVDKVQRMLDEKQRKVSGDEVLCNVIEAMNAWCREKVLASFSPMPADGYPLLQLPPQVKDLEMRLRAESMKGE